MYENLREILLNIRSFAFAGLLEVCIVVGSGMAGCAGTILQQVHTHLRAARVIFLISTLAVSKIQKCW